jgi:hypothetical protein
MISPFSELLTPDMANYNSAENSLAFEGPFLMEDELTSNDLKEVVRSNATIMVTLGWANHLDLIVEKLRTVTTIFARDQFTRDIKYDLLAEAIDRYQLSKGMTTAKRGVMDIETWSVMQDDLGFLHYDKSPRFDIKKAIAANKILKQQLWGKYESFILRFFRVSKLTDYELPLDERYFALILATWQGLDPKIKEVPKDIDGILGSYSWGIMKTELEKNFPELEVKVNIKLNDTAEASKRLVVLVNKLGSRLRDNLEAVKSLLDADIVNEKDSSSMVREGVYLAADAILDIAGETPPGKIIGALGKIALGLVKKHYDEKEENTKKDAKLSAAFSLTDVVLAAKNATYEFTEETVFKQDFDDTIRSIRRQYQSNPKEAEKQVVQEFETFLEYLISLEKTIDDDQKILKMAISSLMRSYSKFTRISVHCQNVKVSIEDWSQEDVNNIIYATDRQRLFLRFTDIYPQVPITEDYISPIGRKILKNLWDIWNNKGFPLKELFLEKDVFIRVNFFERGSNYSFPVITPNPYDVYIKTIKKDERVWTDSTDISGRTADTINFRKGAELKTKGMNEKNARYIPYSDIILKIVNSVMKNEFNTSANSQKVGFIESEVLSGENEAGEFKENHEVPVNNKQTGVSGFLSVITSAKATRLNQPQIQKSGFSPMEIITRLTGVNIAGIRTAILNFNQSNPNNTYQVNNTGNDLVDAVFTEAVHQFQNANYLNPSDQDGIIGQSTLDTLGFINHGLKQKLNSSGFYGQGQLNRRDIKPKIPGLTNNEFSAENWYQFILKPAWLGVKITDGIHILLLRKLKEAEVWLLSQPQYKGMTPVQLGRALGFNAETRYSAGRLSANNEAMHGFGLAIDINVAGNPWIGAGWITTDKILLQERYRMIEVLRKASGDRSLPGDTIFAYLDSIAQSTGDDSAIAYKTLRQRSDQFISYLKMNAAELTYWRNSQSFANRDPLDGFLNLHLDLVYALRQIAGLAWGAIDFGPRASGDIMHFDMRTIDVGKFLSGNTGGFIPTRGHPTIQKEISYGHSKEENLYGQESNEITLHESIGEAAQNETNETIIHENESEQNIRDLEEEEKEEKLYEALIPEVNNSDLRLRLLPVTKHLKMALTLIQDLR